MMIYFSLIFDAIAIIILLVDLFWVNRIAGNIYSRYDLLEDLIVKNENGLESIDKMKEDVKRMKKVISAY